MPRHSKNAGTMGSEGLRYSEMQGRAFGTMSERLGKESVKDWDDCALSLAPAIDPVVTPEGVLYSRELILENLLAQKKERAKEHAAWRAQEEEDARRSAEASAAAREHQLETFHRVNHGGAAADEAAAAAAAAATAAAAAAAGEAVSPTAGGNSGAASVAATHFDRDRMDSMKAFWLPSKTPEAEKRVEKPSGDCLCPATGKKLRLKDLVSVKFTFAPKDAGKGARYMCPLSKEVFGNTSKVVVLKATGDAISEECYKRFVAKDGVYNGVKIKPKEVIRLQRGGTGFAGSGSQVEAKRYAPVGLGSGLADSRGQNRAAGSRFGLTFR